MPDTPRTVVGRMAHRGEEAGDAGAESLLALGLLPRAGTP